ncbi:MAG: sensor histidine kinase [Acidobacteria bacterium]|nr:sensor histidine kinase [Acidobacteriota bacterium]
MQFHKDGPLSSFRAQMVAFIIATILLTAVALSFFNQRLERRTASVVEDYIRDITLATDTVYRSFSSGEYLYDLVNRETPESLTIDQEGVIRRILVVDEEGLIFDSSNENDLKRSYQTVLEEVTTQLTRTDTGGSAAKGTSPRTLGFSIETDRGWRRIFVIISMDRLARVRETGDEIRLIALSIFGLALSGVITAFTLRLTRPVSRLGAAARRVASGEIDFEVPVDGPREVSRLVATFNEMLAVLRRSRDLEEDLRRAERSAVIGRLASGIAHEIRNPLNFINLSIDYLRQRDQQVDPTGRSEYVRILTTIKDEIARLNRLVSDFLTYGRATKLKRLQVDAFALVSEVRSLILTKASEQEVTIQLNCPEPKNSDVTQLAPVTGDPEYLKTCFMNIMINSIQAMPDGGVLTVEFQQEDSQLLIEFRDTGPGMPPDVSERVFEPYFSTKETGIGLGLALTRKIIEEHGGEITVTSHPGQGTTFHICLPDDPPGSSAASSPQTE